MPVRGGGCAVQVLIQRPRRERAYAPASAAAMPRPHLIALDAGGEDYTSRTFSSRRYESQALNSFGHPVPRVAGAMQLHSLPRSQARIAG